MPFAKYCAAGLFLLIAIGCAPRQAPRLFERTAVSSDLSQFRKYVNPPVQPREVTFQTLYMSDPNSRTPGPAAWHLIAVLHYDSEQLVSIIGSAKRLGDQLQLGPHEIAPWFPSEINDLLLKTKSGYTVNAPAYDALNFRKAPLNGGEFVLIANDLFLRLDCCLPAEQ